MIVRRVVAVLAAILIAVVVVRNAAVAKFAQARPDLAAQFWSSHPASELSAAMTQINEAQRRFSPIPPSASWMIADVAAKEPLAPEPFLVRAYQAELAGDDTSAQRAFEAAQWRDPGSLAAASFLAERYLRVGDLDRGLREVAALARLSPNGPTAAGPYLAGYASNRSNWPRLRSFLRANPELADPALVAIASNMRSAPAAFALADPREKLRAAPWLVPLLTTLVRAGQYEETYAIWSRAAGPTSGRQLIHDSAFNDKAAPPPFNWALSSSEVGLAERRPGGRLHLVFRGRKDGILASQLLLLQPGQYRLSMQLIGDASQGRILNWSIWCDKADAPMASVSLDAVAARGWKFAVSSGCPAQWLRLSGSSTGIQKQADVTIAALRLERSLPGA